MAGDCWVACVGGDNTSWAKCRVNQRQQLLHWVEAGRNFFHWLVAPEEDRRWKGVHFARIAGDKSLIGTGESLIATGKSLIATSDSLPQKSSAIEPLPLDDYDELQPDLTSLQSPVTREDLGRATWTFLHSLAAQYPDKPTRQQQKDVRELMAIISRMYPCKECADHFKEVLKSNPVRANSGVDLSQWMCRVHNIVNRSLGKPQFSCERVDARWGALHCDGACDVHGRLHSMKS
ncbi:FAD-linked sulfhydryl oxidase ERV1 [Selaginella moellendorffii]|uniref:FAD-linked sulfhydryl oxidase ERV1 n=1 Tax=Selaginella moellendorffii TaxID=88036 RepID=UPI000D1C9FC2|nr:FAD-linked sulfhydryl oxidase ERV1 [Selaginella moellendorffii]|eukprot:XP_002976837.2 FAD-linked sulfhydryl oxidase ERV1 [Selaginella moellendorffii]